MAVKDFRKQKNIKEEFSNTEDYLRELFQEAKEIVEKAGFEVIEKGEIDSIIEKMFDDSDKFKEMRIKLLDEKNIYILTEDEVKTIQEELSKKLMEKENNSDGDEKYMNDKEGEEKDGDEEKGGEDKEEKKKCASKKEFLEKLITGVNYVDAKEEKNETFSLNLENLIK